MVKTNKRIKMISAMIVGVVFILAVLLALIISGVTRMKKTELTFSTDHMEVLYDGTPVTNHRWHLISGEVAQGHQLSVTVTGEQTEVGESPNTMEVTITDQSGVDVTGDYKIHYALGTLKVNPREITITSASAEKVYDGIALTAPEFEITSNYERALVMGHTAEVKLEGIITEKGEVPNQVREVRILDSNGNDVSRNYLITIQEGKLKVIPAIHKLVFQSMDGEKTYDGMSLTVQQWKLVSGQIKDGHHPVVEFLGEQTEAGESKNLMSVKMFDATGQDVSTEYDITWQYGTLRVNPRVILIESATAAKRYDGTPLRDSSYHVSGDGLAVGHAASTQITGSIVDVGVAPNTIESVSIIDNETGKDVSGNYKVCVKEGTLRITKGDDELVLSTRSAEATYSGSPLRSTGWTLAAGKVKQGHRLQVAVTGSQTNVGESINSMTVTVWNQEGLDVTSEYTIFCDCGTLIVNPRIMTITSASAEKVYDGTPLEDHGFSHTGMPLVAGHKLEVSIVGSITEVGTAHNKINSVVVTYNGQDVSRNYSITIKEGILRVIPDIHELEFRSADREKVYDGIPLIDHQWELISGQLKKGHYPEIEFLGEQSEVGESKNLMSVRILDSQGQDVTTEYKITWQYGTLRVNPRIILIESTTAAKRYDGTPLTAPTYQVSGDGFAMDHTAQVLITGFIIDVGVAANTIESLVIVDARTGMDVSHNYQIYARQGTLRITKGDDELVFSTPSAEIVYSGTLLQATAWRLEAGRLKPGHYLEVTVTGSQTNVGESINSMTVTVLNQEGLDVTSEYTIFCDCGTLIVNPRTITITSASAEKVYDGTPLEDHGFSHTGMPLVEGQELEVSIIGSITNAGTAYNQVDFVRVLDNGKDVSRNYQITIREGFLTVLPNSIADGDDIPGLDISGSLGGGGGSKTDNPVVKVKSSTSSKIYLKQASFGSFLGNAWAQAKPFEDFLLSGNYGLHYLPGLQLEQNGKAIEMMEIEFIHPIYMLPYHLAMESGNYEIQQSDVQFSGSCEEILTVPYYAYTGTGSDLTVSSTEYSFYETVYYAYVLENYLDIDEQTRAYMQELIAYKGFDANDPDIISKVARYIQHAALYNLDYDQTMDAQENVVIAFLDDYREGVCRHYAAAATLLFRALGIPARYTVGYTGQTVAGKWMTIGTKQAHAWTEVYIRGIGWIPVEVTGADLLSGGGGSGGSGGGGGGAFEIENGLLEIRPVSVRKIYDGTPLYPKLEVEGLQELVKRGYTYEVVISGSRTELGISESTIERIKIFDSKGKDVTDTFYLKYKPGKIQIYHTELTFQSEDVTKTYDDIPLAPGVLTEGSLLPGHTMTVTTDTPRGIGTHLNYFTVRILNEKGEDVTSHYYIKKQCGTVKISPVYLAVKAGDAQKAYNGTPLTCNEASIIGSLCSGHVIKEIVISGSQTEIGRSENVVVKIVILDAEGSDVTGNYSIEFVAGVLKVTFS